MSYTSAIMTSGRNANKSHAPLTTQTFAAKLSEPTTGVVAPATSSSSAVPAKARQPQMQPQPPATAPVTPLVSLEDVTVQVYPLTRHAQPWTPRTLVHALYSSTTGNVQVSTVPSPKHHRPPPISSAPPSMTTHLRSSLVHTSVSTTAAMSVAPAALVNAVRSSSPAHPTHPTHAQPMTQVSSEVDITTSSTNTPLTYSLFNSDKVCMAAWLKCL